MTEKVELKVNYINLTKTINRIKKKYEIIGGSWTGKSEPIALKLSTFCSNINDNNLKDDIISLLNEYSSDDLNRRHRFIGISSSDLLILLFNEEMRLSINNNLLTTEYHGKTLITTRNLNGLLSEDISLNSQDNIKFEVKMTVDIISCKKVSFKDNSSDDIIQQLSSGSVKQEDNSSDDIIQKSSSNDTIIQKSNSSDDIIQQLSSSDDIIQESNSSDNVIQQEDNLNDVVNQKSNSSDNITQQSSSNDTINQQENDLKNVVINNKLVNGIMISIVATFIVLLKLKII
jgi:hypothetical protein